MSVDAAEIKGGRSKCNVAIKTTESVPPRKTVGIRKLRSSDNTIKGNFAATRINDTNEGAAFKRSRLGNAEDRVFVFHDYKYQLVFITLQRWDFFLTYANI